MRFERRHDTQVFGRKITFRLEGAVEDCDESLVHAPTLHRYLDFVSYRVQQFVLMMRDRIAREYGLETRLRQNFHQFVHEHMDTQEHYQLMERMRVFNEQGTLSREEWDIACTFPCTMHTSLMIGILTTVCV